MTATNRLANHKILIMATDGFEQSELETPLSTLREAGATVHIASLESDKIKGWDKNDWGNEVDVDLTISQSNASDYDALVLPGGQINPDLLRVEEKAISLIRDFAQAGKPVAAICHAPWLLVEAGLAKGRKLTSYKSIRTDVENAGAEVVDENVVVDGNIITSRCPDDLPDFCEAMIDAVVEASVPAE